VLEHRLVTRSIENAQKKVEARNFDIRKHTLQYDDVMNTQRSVIYSERRKVLTGEDLHATILDMIPEVCERVVAEHLAPDAETGAVTFDPEQLMESLCRALPSLEVSLDRQRFQKQDQQLLVERATDEALKRYAAKEEEFGSDVLREVERRVLLQVIDTHWMHHLQEMDHLREGVHLRAYGQMDPLIQYQKEAGQYFDRLLSSITEDAVRLCFAVEVVGQPQRRRQRVRDLQEGTPMTEARDEMQKRRPARAATKPKRNEPCPCGSGKKYKRCCGAR
jgi:preprotein translocase subunit SecA